MAVTCIYPSCGGDHAWWQCPKKPAGWFPPSPPRQSRAKLPPIVIHAGGETSSVDPGEIARALSYYRKHRVRQQRARAKVRAAKKS